MIFVFVNEDKGSVFGFSPRLERSCGGQYEYGQKTLNKCATRHGNKNGSPQKLLYGKITLSRWYLILNAKFFLFILLRALLMDSQTLIIYSQNVGTRKTRQLWLMSFQITFRNIRVITYVEKLLGIVVTEFFH